MIAGSASLVGRTAEFDRLAALLDTAVAQGRGGAATVSGEPGIGKSALVAAVTGHARRTGWAVLEGRGHDLETRLDYGPLAAALSAHLHRLDPDRRAGYCAGLESLGALVEGIGGPVLPQSPDGPDPSRSRLFQSVALLLGRIAADAPVLLVLDDLHWADPASVDVLSYLRADLDALGVVLLVALRTPVESARPDVRRLVAELARSPLQTTVTLRRLGPGRVGELAAALLGGPVHPTLAALLTERSAGTPLVVQAMLHDLAARDALTDGPDGWRCADPDPDVPTHLRELFGAGLRRLDDAARATLEAVCLGGSPVPHRRLTALTGADDVELGGIVSSLRDAGLLAEERRHGRVHYAPAHPLIADAVLAGTSAAARARVHARYVEVLTEEGETAPHVLARHHLGARDLLGRDRTAAVLTEAGRISLRRGAPVSAARWLGAAVEVADPAAAGPALFGLGMAEQQCGDTRGAVATLLTAAERLRRNRSWREAATAAGQAARLAWLVDDTATARRASALAVELSAAGDVLVRVSATHAHAATLVLTGDADAAQQVLTGADAELDAVDHPGRRERLAGYAEFVRFVAGTGDGPSALRRLRAPVPPDPSTLYLDIACSNARVELAVALGAWTDLDDELVVARRLGEAGPGTPRLWRSPIAAFHRRWATGDWDGAADVLTEAAGDRAAVPSVDAMAPERHAMQTWLALNRGVVPDDPELPGPRYGPDRGLAEILSALVTAQNGGRPPMVRTSWQAVFENWRRLARMEALAGDRPGLRAEADRLIRIGGADSALGALAERARALAADTRDDAARHADRAARAYRRLGMVVDAATVRIETAEAHGYGVADVDVGLLERIGARPLVERARRLHGGPAAVDPARPTLSPREREVAELVADGLSNAAIAERLVVSVRTVTSHLDHAYTKLGIGSRTELAREIRGPVRNSPDAR